MINPFLQTAFPRAVLHIDGDAFFASCEIAQDERLRGRPVVTGVDKGIATAVTYEAKALGVARGMPIYYIKKEFPNVIITSSHYQTYKIYSRRMYDIVRRYTPFVEEYSVDECFGDFTFLQDSQVLEEQNINFTEYVTRIARNIKRDLERDLGMTFSIGLAPTKTLAKVASKIQKPAGFTVITGPNIHLFLEKVAVNKVWGIGGSTSVKLRKHGIITALDFALEPEWWIKENFAKPYRQIWHELRGTQIHEVCIEERDTYKSVMKTRTFKATKDKDYILSELCRNVERACMQLRKYNLLTRDVAFYLKTQRFQYTWAEVRLDTKTSVPRDLIKAIAVKFPSMYTPKIEYRSTGVVLRDISPESAFQPDLFNKSENLIGEIKLFKTVDEMIKKYGNQALFLAGSLQAHNERLKSKTLRKLNRAVIRGRALDLETDFLKLGIPSWGEAE